MLVDGEIAEENVVLGTKTEARPNAVNVTPNVKAVDDRRSTRWWEKPCITRQPSQHRTTAYKTHQAHTALRNGHVLIVNPINPTNLHVGQISCMKQVNG